MSFPVTSLLKAVLFDLGDTLIGNEKLWAEIRSDGLKSSYTFLRENGYKLDFRTFESELTKRIDEAELMRQKQLIEIPIEDIFQNTLQALGEAKASVLVPSIVERYFQPEFNAWRLYDDVSETLAELRTKGLELGLVSNTWSDWAVRMMLRNFGIDKWFDVAVTSAQLRIRKPRPEIFLAALDALKARPSEAAMVGNSLVDDMQGAKHLGMRAIHVERDAVASHSDVDPDATVEQIRQVLPLIEEWIRS